MIAADLAAVAARIAAIDPSPQPHDARMAPPASVASARAAGPRFDALVASDMARIVRTGANAVGLDPNLATAVAQTESHFDPSATSRTGAAGLMQLMPDTARTLGVGDTYDPVQNARGGATYLRQLLDRFGGNVRLAVAAYNAGPGAVERYGAIPPFAETQTYVERVMDAYRGTTR